MSISEVSKYNVNLNDNCSICLESFEQDRDSLVHAACAHIFHENCFVQWRMTPKEDGYERQEKSCPLCRGPLSTAQYIKPDADEQTAHVHSTILPYVTIPGAVPSVPVEAAVDEVDVDHENFIAIPTRFHAHQEAEDFLERVRTNAMIAHIQPIRERIIRENQAASGWGDVIGIGIAAVVVILPIFLRFVR
jgi:Ring finger domain